MRLGYDLISRCRENREKLCYTETNSQNIIERENTMASKICDGVYTFKITLPENPLRSLNCYVILGEKGGRNLIIDTGFRRPECQRALEKGMEELDIDPAVTDVFITHSHSDHSGNAQWLISRGCRAIMGRVDHGIVLNPRSDLNRQRTLAEGMPKELVQYALLDNPAIKFAPGPFEAMEADAGDVMSYGGFQLECVCMPGHTPGHMCLYERRHKMMFLGDHILFDITPNITYWAGFDDELGQYLESLKRIRSYDIDIALPGHRSMGMTTVEDRANALLAHHKARLMETRRVIQENPGISAYDAAGLMTWRIRSKNWEEFPKGQKWFAMGEAAARLEYLNKQNLISIHMDDNGILRYFPR